MVQTRRVGNLDVYAQNANISAPSRQRPSAPSAPAELVDSKPPVGRNSYCVRITQADGQIAWPSPVRVEQG